MQPERLRVGQVVMHVWSHAHELGADGLQFPGLRAGGFFSFLPPSEDNVNVEDGEASIGYLRHCGKDNIKGPSLTVRL